VTQTDALYTEHMYKHVLSMYTVQHLNSVGQDSTCDFGTPYFVKVLLSRPIHRYV